MVKKSVQDAASGSLREELARTGAAGYLACSDLWRRSFGIGARFLEQAARSAYRGATDGGKTEAFEPTLISAYQSYLSEMAGVLPLAMERFAVALAGPMRAPLPGDEQAPPVSTYEIQGKLVGLPARIQDAAQGIALFTVPADAAQAWLDESTPVSESESAQRPFKVLWLKENQTPLAIFMVDYRVSDLGAYHEVGVALFVTPATDPAAMPGMYIMELPVNGDFTREAGEKIWGYPKSLADLQFEYRTDRVDCELRRAKKGAKGSGEEVMKLTYTRYGTGSSTKIPLYSYTLKGGVPTFTIFTRSGQGEHSVAGGEGFSVELGKTDPLAERLRSLGLPKAPIMQAWTEHMSGNFGVPHPLP